MENKKISQIDDVINYVNSCAKNGQIDILNILSRISDDKLKLQTMEILFPKYDTFNSI